MRQSDWPDELRDRSAVAEGLAATGVTDATSLLFEFDDAQLENVVKALEAPVCEFVGIHPFIFFQLSLAIYFTYSESLFSQVTLNFINKHVRHAFD